MKSLARKFSSARGWALLLVLFLGTGLVVGACGDDDSPTTPAPAPAPTPPPPAPEPEPEPEPEAPAVPTGLRLTATGTDFIEWSWTPVPDVTGYDVQYSTNEAFTDEDEVIARTAEEISYRREDLEAETSGYVRVRSAAGSGEDRVTSDWSPHVPGMTDAPLVAPATPTGFMVSEATESSITWRWDAVAGAQGYVVQVSPDEAFEDMFEGADAYFVTTETSYMTSGQQPETTLYVRVAAGVLTAAAPSSDPGDYLISAWTSHATGKTKAAEPDRPAAPANVRVTGRGSSHLEWQWDEVPGASGYQSEFSNTSTFADGPAGREVHSGMSSTRRRVANLDSESDGYLRVRTFTGTVTEPTFGDWSEASKGTTDEPAPAVALDAPGDLGATDRGENSITLEWNEVDDAETYAVRQRESGGAWANASCGSATADNIVDETECVASGLDEGTDYDFQVRAIPADDDDAHLASAWSDTHEDRTTGTSTPTTPTPTTGGSGDLNVTWESTTEEIRWVWDRLPGATYDYIVLTGNDLPRVTSATPCANLTYPDQTSGVAATSVTSNTSPALLCVRTTNPDDRSENLSYARAVHAPAAPAAPAATGVFPAGDSGKATTSLTWTGMSVTAGFTYEMSVIADRERDNAITASIPTGDALQRACNAGTLLETEETDVDLTNLQATLTSVRPYTGYLLCLRMKNDSGTTAWAVPTSNAEHQTAPGRAPVPRKNASRSEDDRDADNEMILWEMSTRGNADVPRLPSGYNIFTISHSHRNDGDDDTFHDDAVTRPRAADCAPGELDGNVYTRTDAGPSAAPTSQGFTVSFSPDRPTTERAVRQTNGTDVLEIIPDVVSLCVQAKYGTGPGERVGPWSISAAETIEKKADQN